MKYCTIRDGGDEKGTVFILHGAFADRTAQDRLAEIIHQKGYTVICCDARGHGENEGRIHEWKKTVQEYNKRIKKHPSEQIIVIGHSMGGTQAISLTKNPKVSQVFSISPAHNSGPFDNMNILSRLFFAANIEPKEKGQETLDKKTEKQKFSEKELPELLLSRKELESEIKHLNGALNQIGLYFERVEQEKPFKKEVIYKVRRKINKHLSKLKDKELVRSFLEYSNNMKEKIEDKIWIQRIRDLNHKVKGLIHVKTYYLSMKERIREIENNRDKFEDLLPENLELTKKQTKKLYIIASKMDLIIPFDHVEQIIRKYQIPEERTLILKSVFHGFTDDVKKTQDFILTHISD